MKKLLKTLNYLFGPIILAYVCYLGYALVKMFISWKLYKPLYPFSGEHLYIDRILLLFGFFLLLIRMSEGDIKHDNEDWDRFEGEF